MAELEGPDASIEISLREYGIAWKIGETETQFYYGVSHDGQEYTGFDWACLVNDLDVHTEYDWVDFGAIMRFTGMSPEEWEKTLLTQKVYDLLLYYGVENIFGSSYTEPMTYEEVIKGK